MMNVQEKELIGIWESMAPETFKDMLRDLTPSLRLDVDQVLHKAQCQEHLDRWRNMSAEQFADYYAVLPMAAQSGVRYVLDMAAEDEDRLEFAQYCLVH